MELGALRELARDLNFEVLGVALTVAPPNQVPVDTRGIWLAPVTGIYPLGTELHRREAPRVLALPRGVLPSVPRGTLITVPAADPATALDAVWQVDGVDRAEADHHRVIVVPYVES
jgi:hypothetical protein